MTAKELAEALGKSLITIRRWTREGKIPCEREGRRISYDLEKVKGQIEIGFHPPNIYPQPGCDDEDVLPVAIADTTDTLAPAEADEAFQLVVGRALGAARLAFMKDLRSAAHIARDQGEPDLAIRLLDAALDAEERIK